MTTFGWRTQRSVEEWLFAEPYRFDFFQAVRLLEILRRDAAPPGEGFDPEKEAVRFHSRFGLDFPASEVQQIAPPATPGAPAEMTVNFMGLAGAFGPLPMPDTEMLLERARGKDFAMRDFLDIFNHRLVSLMYQVRKLHRLALTRQAPEETRTARYLYSFFGAGLSELRRGLRTPAPNLLFCSGILSQQPRSAVGLERLLAHHFQMGVKVRQLVGRWRSLEPDQWSRIGSRGRNQRLGSGVVVGTRVWDQQGAFRVELGPLHFGQLLDLLPPAKAFRSQGKAYPALCELTRFYAGPEFEFQFRLTLRAAEVPASKLGAAQLGWTSWLKTRESTGDDSQVRLGPA
ncbi:MAG TPA: type VI secretion system baseplate subunit TssG [Candidatus Sulfopaludibacter sp.]|nr:type VI secretion system baseplate subunit TssG [Candidatus Sulfopaludibacter sp.]